MNKIKQFLTLIIGIFLFLGINAANKKLTIINNAGKTNLAIRLGDLSSGEKFDDFIERDVQKGVPLTKSYPVEKLSKINYIIIAKNKEQPAGEGIVGVGLGFLKNLFGHGRLSKGITDLIILKPNLLANIKDGTTFQGGRFGDSSMPLSHPARWDNSWGLKRTESNLGTKFQNLVSNSQIKEIILNITRSRLGIGKFFNIDISSR